jgi:hypothetical protein
MSKPSKHPLAAAGTILAGFCLAAATSALGAPKPGSAPSDSSLILGADAEGSVLRSLTIEGENRIRFAFERPALVIDLDPAQAPGLAWGDAKDVLDRTLPDHVGPLLQLSMAGLSPYLPQPWREELRTGPVARELQVVDARGEVVREYAGDRRVPDEIAWDGRDRHGEPATPGLTYSYVFTAHDRAGNRKRFVGDGFPVPPMRLQTDRGPLMIFPGDALGPADSRGAAPRPTPLVREVASWLNRALGPSAPILITATAPSGAEAEQLGARLREILLPLLPGEPARVSLRVKVQAGGPQAGSLRVEPAPAQVAARSTAG